MNSQKEMIIPKDIFLPQNTAKFDTDYGILYVAPHIGSAILTDQISEYLIEQLKKDSNVNNAFNNAVKYFDRRYTEKEIYISFINIIGQIKIEQFEENTEVYKPNFNQIEKGLHIYLTQKCNLKCIHCYNNASENINYEGLNIGQLKQVVDTFAPYVINYSFSGGEPLKSPYFFELAEYIKGKYPDKTLTLYTNGTLISTMEIAEHISELFDEVQVSMDGATAEIVNKIRGNNAYDKIIKGLKNLVATKKPIKELAISICLFDICVDDIANNLIKVLDDIDQNKRIKSIRFAPIEDEGRGNENMNYNPTPENIAKLANVQHIINSSGRRVWERAEEEMLRKYYSFNKGNTRRVAYTCSFGQTLALDTNGDLYPCAIKKEDAKLGNFFEDDFRERMLSEWKTCFEMHSIDNMAKCKACEIRYYCFAGCRLKNKKVTGAYNVAHCDKDIKLSKVTKIARNLALNYSDKTRQILDSEPTL